MKQREAIARLQEKHRALTRRVDNQDGEFKRRLIELNGEHGRIADIVTHTQSETAARASEDKLIEKMNSNDRAVDLRLKALEGAGREGAGRAVIPNLIWYAAAAALGAWIWNQIAHR